MFLKVLIINGAGTSGKDSFIDLFTEVAQSYSSKCKTVVHRFSSVDQIKEYAFNMGWDGVKDEAGRQFLSDIKDACTRYNNGPFNYMGAKVSEVLKESLTQDDLHTAFVFFHVREPEEIAKMVNVYQATSILVTREGIHTFTNHADSGVYYYAYDYHVENNGTIDDLKSSAETIFCSLISGGVGSCQQ